MKAVSRAFAVSGSLFRNPRRLRAVQEITLDLEKGEVFAVAGESGSGKTTLARMVLGLIPPTSGTITLDGADIATIPRRALAARVQPVFQDPYSSLNPRRQIASIVAVPLRVQRRGGRKEWRQQSLEMLDKVGLPERLARAFPAQLSGGQRQRVALARALVTNPDIVVCDEPTSALDVSVQSQIINLLMDLKAQYNLTYIFISHNLAVVEHIATRVAVMYLGRIVELAPTAVLFGEPRHPYTQALIASILTPEPGPGLPNIGLGLSFPDPLNPPSGCAFHPRCPHAKDICRKVEPKLAGPTGHRTACHLHNDIGGST